MLLELITERPSLALALPPSPCDRDICVSPPPRATNRRSPIGETRTAKRSAVVVCAFRVGPIHVNTSSERSLMNHFRSVLQYKISQSKTFLLCLAYQCGCTQPSGRAYDPMYAGQSADRVCVIGDEIRIKRRDDRPPNVRRLSSGSDVFDGTQSAFHSAFRFALISNFHSKFVLSIIFVSLFLLAARRACERRANDSTSETVIATVPFCSAAKKRRENENRLMPAIGCVSMCARRECLCVD